MTKLTDLIEKHNKAYWIGYLVLNILFAFCCVGISDIGAGVLGILVFVVGGILAIALAILGLILLFKGAWVVTLLCWAGAALLGFIVLSVSDWIFQAAWIIMAIYILFRYRKSTLAFNPASGTKLGVAIRITSLIYPALMALSLIMYAFWWRRDGHYEHSVQDIKMVNLVVAYIGGGCYIAHTIMMFYCAVKAWRNGEKCVPSA